MAIRLLGRPLDAAEHAAALKAAAAGATPPTRSLSPVPLTAMSTGRGLLLPAPTFRPALTPPGAVQSTPCGAHFTQPPCLTPAHSTALPGGGSGARVGKAECPVFRLHGGSTGFWHPALALPRPRVQYAGCLLRHTPSTYAMPAPSRSRGSLVTVHCVFSQGPPQLRQPQRWRRWGWGWVWTPPLPRLSATCSCASRCLLGLNL